MYIYDPCKTYIARKQQKALPNIHSVVSFPKYFLSFLYFFLKKMKIFNEKLGGRRRK